MLYQFYSFMFILICNHAMYQIHCIKALILGLLPLQEANHIILTQVQWSMCFTTIGVKQLKLLLHLVIQII